MENPAVWLCPSNDAIHISLIQPGDGGLKAISSFQPQYTYPIFGDEETIFGYKGLLIKLRFAAHDLRSQVQISYDEKIQPVGRAAATDLNEALKPFLPEESFGPEADFEQSVLNDPAAKDFKPPGILVHSYTRKDRSYEIWAGSLADAEVRALLDRMQIFVSLFIEGGTPIETDDFKWTLQRWTVYFVYEKLVEPPTPSASVYSFVGYATTYQVYFHDKSSTKQQHQVSEGPFPFTESLDVFELPSRLRIAQFLILPPHQECGHGTQLYRTIHRACMDDPAIYELTVEDPNEAFDALRDRNDYYILEPVFSKHNITINPDPYTPEQARRRPRLMPTSNLIPTSTLRDLRAKYKIAPTQFAHIVEMYLLSQIPETHRGEKTNLTRVLMQKYRAQNEHDRRYYWWRMLVKQRLYKRHRDMLTQIDLQERIDKLEETLRNVEEGYESLLKAFTAKAARREEAVSQAQEKSVKGKQKEEDGEEELGGEEGPSRERGKRKFVVFEEEDDGEGPESETNGASKKAKV
ncbi:hypothetical protein VTO42DRAFT_8014 [Malbranchea cinnamomea]